LKTVIETVSHHHTGVQWRERAKFWKFSSPEVGQKKIPLREEKAE